MVTVACPTCLSTNVNSDPEDETFMICLNEDCKRHRIFQEVQEEKEDPEREKTSDETEGDYEGY